MTDRERAQTPEDLTRLFVERGNAADAEGAAALYEPDAVLAYPPGDFTVGRDAIQALFEKMFASRPHFEPEPPLPTVLWGDLALTSTPPKDGAGARAQVVRRQTDGTWLRAIDQPEFRRVEQAG
jgi:ketosteroid isomerase-like protein